MPADHRENGLGVRVVQSRHGSGTYIAEGPPALDSEPLRMLAELYRFTPDEMFETRKLLEVGLAGLAAQHAQPEQPINHRHLASSDRGT